MRERTLLRRLPERNLVGEGEAADFLLLNGGDTMVFRYLVVSGLIVFLITLFISWLNRFVSTALKAIVFLIVGFNFGLSFVNPWGTKEALFSPPVLEFFLAVALRTIKLPRFEPLRILSFDWPVPVLPPTLDLAGLGI